MVILRAKRCEERKKIFFFLGYILRRKLDNDNYGIIDDEQEACVTIKENKRNITSEGFNVMLIFGSF